MTTMTNVRLSDDQCSAVEKIRAWADTDRPSFVLGGLAGTGKTLVSSYIANEALSDRVSAIVAPTGKAASRLRQKGIERAMTLHSFLYTYGGSYENDEGETELVFHDEDLAHRVKCVVAERDELHAQLALVTKERNALRAELNKLSSELARGRVELHMVRVTLGVDGPSVPAILDLQAALATKDAALRWVATHPYGGGLTFGDAEPVKSAIAATTGTKAER